MMIIVIMRVSSAPRDYAAHNPEQRRKRGAPPSPKHVDNSSRRDNELRVCLASEDESGGDLRHANVAACMTAGLDSRHLRGIARSGTLRS